jgi:superfamily I DNA/RNA helicase
VAAEDLHRELQKLNVPGCEALRGQTLHSLAMRILARAHVLAALGRHARPLNRFELKALHADLGPAHGGLKACKKLIADYEAAWAQTQGDDPGFAKNAGEQAFEKALISWMIFHESMLIGEVVPYLVRFLKTNPAAPEHVEFAHLLIDEFQDLNKAEQTALAYMGAKAMVCVVGDDDQSIYSFKSAHPDGIRQWKDQNPGCADLAMTDCHRCPTSVVSMANSLIAHKVHRTERNLLSIAAKGPGEVKIVQLGDPDAEADWIASKIASLTAGGAHPSDIIVLAQRSKVAKRILEALKGKGVPAKSYYDESQLDSEAAQVRFSLLKILLNPDDRVALRYLLGVGSGNYRSPAYAKIRAHCEETGFSPWAALEQLSQGIITIKHTGHLVEVYSKIREQIAELEAKGNDLAALVDELFPEADPDVADLRDLALTVIKDLEVVNTASLFEKMMEEITQPDIPPTVEEVRVMSLHKSKGLSSPYVFIASCVQGIVPQLAEAGTPKVLADAKLEEARRLFFVGITRVKADPDNGKPGSLYLTYPREMNAGEASGAKISFQKVVFGKAQLLPSMFVAELGQDAPAPEAA